MTRVRRAVPGDLLALLRLADEFCEIDAHPYDEQRVRRGLEPILENDALGQVWVAVQEMDLAGYAVLTWGWGLETGGREGLLDEFYVAKRGDGIGGTLLTRVLAEAGTAGCLTVFLETEKPNEAARRFYRRHGFTRQESVWMSIDVGGDPED